LASHVSGALSGLVAVPTSTLVGVIDALEAPAKVFCEMATNLPDRMEAVYDGGRKMMAEASGVNPESPTWEKDFSKLSWWRRSLACLVGCLSVIVDVPIYVAGGALRATATFASKIVTLPFRVLASAGNAYNYGRLVSMAHSSSDESLNEVARAIGTSPNLWHTQQTLGLDADKLAALGKVMLELREERAELKARAAQIEALEAAKQAQIEAVVKQAQEEAAAQAHKKVNGKGHKHELALNPT
jgi:hypothetical protein